MTNIRVRKQSFPQKVSTVSLEKNLFFLNTILLTHCILNLQCRTLFMNRETETDFPNSYVSFADLKPHLFSITLRVLIYDTHRLGRGCWSIIKCIMQEVRTIISIPSIDTQVHHITISYDHCTSFKPRWVSAFRPSHSDLDNNCGFEQFVIT